MSHRGFHAARIPVVDLALWDVVGTLLLVVITARTARLPVTHAALWWMLAATVAHTILGVPVRLLGTKHVGHA